MWCLKSSASAVRLQVKSGIQLEVGLAEDPNLAQLRKSNPQMEDEISNVSLGDGEYFFAIFDGHGGQEVAKYCKERTHSLFFDQLQANPTDLKKVWEDTYRIIDKEIDEKYSENDCDCMGCTSTTCYIRRVPDGWKVSCANVGDSAALFWTNSHNGFLTTMHRPTNESEATRVLSAGGKITGERTKRINGQLVVTRALGDHFMKKNSKGLISIPYVCEDVVMKPENNAILLIASDGVWDVVPDATVIRLVADKAASSAQEIAEELVNLAVKKQSVDNITCVVIKAKSS